MEMAKLKLVSADGGASISVALNNSNGTLQSPTVYTLAQYGCGQSVPAIAVGDFNHDGKLDVAVAVSVPGANASTCCPAQTPSGDILIFLGNGDGTLQAPTTISLSYPALSLAAADFSGDGVIDLTVLRVNFYGFPSTTLLSAAVSVLLGNGNGTFQAPQSVSVPATASELVVGDFNNDGHFDFATANQKSISILIGNGDGTLQSPSTLAVAAGALGVADFNGDGRLDIACSSNGGSAVSMLLGNGDGTFQSPRTSALGDRLADLPEQLWS